MRAAAGSTLCKSLRLFELSDELPRARRLLRRAPLELPRRLESLREGRLSPGIFFDPPFGPPLEIPLDISLGTPLGAPLGAPPGAPPGAPLGSPLGAILGSPLGAPVGAPVGALLGSGLRRIARRCRRTARRRRRRRRTTPTHPSIVASPSLGPATLGLEEKCRVINGGVGGGEGGACVGKRAV